MKKSLNELQFRNKDINDRLGEIYTKAANEKRELNAEEKTEVSLLTNELEANRREIMLAADASTIANIRESANKNAQLRELLKNQLQTRTAYNAILLSKDSDNTTNTIENSEAIVLRIEDLINTTSEGLGLPDGLRMQTGVTGNEVWPVSTNDVDYEEPDEIVALNDQKLDFTSISPVQHRVGVTVPVSNMAIDNAAFDLYAFVTEKFQKANRRYMAKKYYWPSSLTGNKGPFAGQTPGTIALGVNAYENILTAVAEIANKGFEGEPVLSFDKLIEAKLKATPKISGAAGGFVIENGLCAGYKYTTSHYVNGNTNKQYFEISFPEWFAIQQHGTVRFTVDTISQAKKNITQLTLNTAYSFTELSNKVDGNADGKPQAFKIFEIVDDDYSGTDM